MNEEGRAGQREGCNEEPREEPREERVVPLRLQKFLARAGVASRRGAENLMTAGRVTVNGSVVTELGSRVDPRVDEVRVDGMPVRPAGDPVTLVLHKPAGVITTMSDQRGRACVADLVPRERYPGLFPIGRLDADTTGALLFSTDGELGQGLLHPSREVGKRYLALAEGVVDESALARLRSGLVLDDGPCAPAQASVLTGAAAEDARALLEVRPDARVAPARAWRRSRVAARQAGGAAAGAHAKRALSAHHRDEGAGRTGGSIVELVIHEGRYHQVKRMMAAVGHPVVALHRAAFGPVGVEGVERGHWRLLTAEEVRALNAAAHRGRP